MPDHKLPPERPLVLGDQPVTLVGGGVTQPNDLQYAMAIAPTLVAVDGGADVARDAGATPTAIIGDLDSVSEQSLRAYPPELFHQISEQDSTDFDKALRHLDVPLVLAIGFTGARLDHELAVFHSLVARPKHRCVVIGERDIVFHAPPKLALDLPAGTRVSLFPLASVSGRSRGLRWPIDGLVFHPAERIGTSNEATGGALEIDLDAPGLLVILPREVLPSAASALVQPVDNMWIL